MNVGLNMNCVICIGAARNLSIVEPCLHSFCYECIWRWSMRRNSCPLCNTKFRRLRHTIRSENDYDIITVPDVRTESDIESTDSFFNVRVVEVQAVINFTVPTLVQVNRTLVYPPFNRPGGGGGDRSDRTAEINALERVAEVVQTATSGRISSSRVIDVSNFAFTMPTPDGRALRMHASPGMPRRPPVVAAPPPVRQQQQPRRPTRRSNRVAARNVARGLAQLLADNTQMQPRVQAPRRIRRARNVNRRRS